MSGIVGCELNHNMKNKIKYNLFRWYEVVLNLTGDPGYQPHRPLVSKRREKGCVSEDLFMYVENRRPQMSTEEDYWDNYSRWV